MYKLVILRHGQSIWNKENLFTGWTDVDLSAKGIEEAHNAGNLLKDAGFNFDIAFTSFLKRAIRTLNIALYELDRLWIPVYKSWRLNERHYGALQGLSKAKTAERLGEKQVFIWRRSYDVPPPPLEDNDERYPGNLEQYRNIPKNRLPKTECLRDTVERFLPYWHDTIAPTIKEGKKVIITAHGNSLRALCKYLDQIPDDEIAHLNIPTGNPLVYVLDGKLKPIKHYYLGDPKEAKKATEKMPDKKSKNQCINE